MILYIVGDNGTACDSGLNGAADALESVDGQLKRLDDLGGPNVPFNHYSLGWTWLGSTPFQYWKAVASHFGGVRDPLIVSWPARISDHGGLRSQFAHVNDVAATLYESAGINLPQSVDGVEQHPLDGVSFLHTFDSPHVPSQHHTQYFETLGHRALYHRGWVAAAAHKGLAGEVIYLTDCDYSHDRWELYHLEKDFSEAHDVAKEYPEKLKELQELFDIEARKNDVYPLGACALAQQDQLTAAPGKRDFVYYPGTPRIDSWAMPGIAGNSYRISAQVTIPKTGAQGVILSYGGRLGGVVLYIIGGKLIFENNIRNQRHEIISSECPVPHGDVALRFEYARVGAISDHPGGWYSKLSTGIGRLLIDGEVVGQGEVTGAFWTYFNQALGIGQAHGSPVSDAFRLPFKFTGTLEQVRIELLE